MDIPNNPTPTQPAEESWIILRPLEVLMDLPFTFRWEVTRRHPCYLRLWELARGHYSESQR